MTVEGEIDEEMRTQWRELGFFYDRNDDEKEWVLVGSKRGLGRFRDLLLAYAADPRNQQVGEHEHYGPYSYLKITTSDRLEIDSDGIHGSPDQVRRLAEIVGEKLNRAAPETSVRIDSEYADAFAFSLVLEVRGDDFDPASADRALGV